MNSDTNALADRAKLDAAGAAKRALFAEADREELRRRLAAVEALCDRQTGLGLFAVEVEAVRAAARGES